MITAFGKKKTSYFWRNFLFSFCYMRSWTHSSSRLDRSISVIALKVSVVKRKSNRFVETNISIRGLVLFFYNATQLCCNWLSYWSFKWNSWNLKRTLTWVVRIFILKIQVLEILMEIGPTAIALSTFKSSQKTTANLHYRHYRTPNCKPTFLNYGDHKAGFFKLNTELSVHTE